MEEIEYLEEYEDLILPNSTAFSRDFTERTSVDSLEALYKDLLGEACETEIGSTNEPTTVLADVEKTVNQSTVNIGVPTQSFQITNSNTSSVSTSQNIALVQEPLYQQQTTSFSIDRATSSFPSSSTGQRKSVATVKPTLQRAYTSKRNNSPPLKKSNLAQSHYQSKFVPPPAPFSTKSTTGFKVPNPNPRKVKKLKSKSDFRKRKSSAVDPLSLDDTDELLDFEVEKGGCMDDFDLESDLDNSIVAGISDIDSDSLNLSDDYSDSNLDLESDLSSEESDPKHGVPYKKKRFGEYEAKEKSVTTSNDFGKDTIAQSRDKPSKRFIPLKEPHPYGPKIIAVENIPIRHSFTRKEMDPNRFPTPVDAPTDTSTKRTIALPRKPQLSEKLPKLTQSLKSPVESIGKSYDSLPTKTAIANGKEIESPSFDNFKSTAQSVRTLTSSIGTKSVRIDVHEHEPANSDSYEPGTSFGGHLSKKPLNFSEPKNTMESQSAVLEQSEQELLSGVSPPKKLSNFTGTKIMQTTTKESESSSLGTPEPVIPSPIQWSKKSSSFIGPKSMRPGFKQNESATGGSLETETTSSSVQSPRKVSSFIGLKSMQTSSRDGEPIVQESFEPVRSSLKSPGLIGPKRKRAHPERSESAIQEIVGSDVSHSMQLKKSKTFIGPKSVRTVIEENEQATQAQGSSEGASGVQTSRKTSRFFGPKSMRPTNRGNKEIIHKKKESGLTTPESSEPEASAVRPSRKSFFGPKSMRPTRRESDQSAEESSETETPVQQPTKKSPVFIGPKSRRTGNMESEPKIQENPEPETSSPPSAQLSRKSSYFIGPKSMRPSVKETELIACDSTETESSSITQEPKKSPIFIGPKSRRTKSRESKTQIQESSESEAPSVQQSLQAEPTTQETTEQEEPQQSKKSPNFIGPKSMRPSTTANDNKAQDDYESESSSITRPLEKSPSFIDPKSRRLSDKESESTFLENVEPEASSAVQSSNKSPILTGSKSIGASIEEIEPPTLESSEPETSATRPSRKSGDFIEPKSLRSSSRESDHAAQENCEAETTTQPSGKSGDFIEPKNMPSSNREIDHAAQENSETETTTRPSRKSGNLIEPKSLRSSSKDSDHAAQETCETETTSRPSAKSGDFIEPTNLPSSSRESDHAAQETCETETTTRPSGMAGDFIDPKNLPSSSREIDHEAQENSKTETATRPSRKSGNLIEPKSLRSSSKDSDHAAQENSETEIPTIVQTSKKFSFIEPKSTRTGSREREPTTQEITEPQALSPAQLSRKSAHLIEPKSSKTSSRETSETEISTLQQPSKKSSSFIAPKITRTSSRESELVTSEITEREALSPTRLSRKSAHLMEPKSSRTSSRESSETDSSSLLQNSKKSSSSVRPKSARTSSRESEPTAQESTEPQTLSPARLSRKSASFIQPKSTRTSSRESSEAETSSLLQTSKKSPIPIGPKTKRTSSKESEPKIQGNPEPEAFPPARLPRKPANFVEPKGLKTSGRENEQTAEENSETDASSVKEPPKKSSVSIGPESLRTNKKELDSMTVESSGSTPQPARRSGNVGTTTNNETLDEGSSEKQIAPPNRKLRVKDNESATPDNTEPLKSSQVQSIRKPAIGLRSLRTNNKDSAAQESSSDAAIKSGRKSLNLIGSRSVRARSKEIGQINQTKDTMEPEMQSGQKLTNTVGVKNTKSMDEDDKATTHESVESAITQPVRKSLTGLRSTRNNKEPQVSESESAIQVNSETTVQPAAPTVPKGTDSINQGNSELESTDSAGSKSVMTSSNTSQKSLELIKSLNSPPVRRSMTAPKTLKTTNKGLESTDHKVSEPITQSTQPSEVDAVNISKIGDNTPSTNKNQSPPENNDSITTTIPEEPVQKSASTPDKNESTSTYLRSTRPPISRQMIRRRLARRRQKSINEHPKEDKHLVIFQTNKISPVNVRLNDKLAMPPPQIPPGEEKVTFSFDPKAFQRRPSVAQSNIVAKSADKTPELDATKSPAKTLTRSFTSWRQTLDISGRSSTKLLSVHPDTTLRRTPLALRTKRRTLNKKTSVIQTPMETRSIKIRLSKHFVEKYFQEKLVASKAAQRDTNNESKSKETLSPRKKKSHITSIASPSSPIARLEPTDAEKVPVVTAASKKKKGKRKDRRRLEGPPKLLRSSLKVQTPESINLKLSNMILSIYPKPILSDASEEASSAKDQVTNIANSIQTTAEASRQEYVSNEPVDQVQSNNQLTATESAESAVVDANKTAESVGELDESSASIENQIKTPQKQAEPETEFVSGTEVSIVEGETKKKRSGRQISMKLRKLTEKEQSPKSADPATTSNLLSDNEFTPVEQIEELPPIQQPAEVPSTTGCLRIEKVNSISSLQFESEMTSDSAEIVQPKTEPYAGAYTGQYQPELISTEALVQSIKTGFLSSDHRSEYRSGQHQTAVYELPAFIVMKTKIITRNELNETQANIPPMIKEKVSKLAEVRQETTPPVKEERPEFKDICLEINNLLGKNANYLKFASSSERLTRMNQIMADNTLSVEDAQCTLKFLQSYLTQRVEAAAAAKAKSQQFIPIYDSQKKIIGYRKRTVNSRRRSSRDGRNQPASHRMSTQNNKSSISSSTYTTNSGSFNRQSAHEMVTTVKELEISTKKEPVVLDGCDAEVIVPDASPTNDKRVKDEADLVGALDADGNVAAVIN